MTDRYQIRVSGRLGPVLCRALTGTPAAVVPRETVIHGWLSRDDFRALMLRMEKLRGQLVRLDCLADDHRPGIGWEPPVDDSEPGSSDPAYG